MTDQAVGGISVPLTIDRTGWSAGLKAARDELEQFKKEAQSAGAPSGGGRSIRGGFAAGATAVPPQSQLPTVGNVSPRFAVSQGSIREMRVQMNAQIRQLAAQGEAVSIPVKLGRVPYAALRNEISTGIGEVPVRITLDPGSIAIIRGQITGAIGRSGSGGRVSEGQTSLPIVKRATGGPVSPHQEVIVGDGGRAEVFRPTQAGRIMPQVTMADQMRQRQLAIIRQQIQQDRGTYPKAMAGMQVHGRYSRSQAMRGLSPQQGNFDANIMAAVGRLQPHHIQGGINWYREMAAYGQARSKHYGVPPQTGIGVLAALSAGTEWQANKTKFERIMAAHAAGRPFPYETKATGQMSMGLSTAERKKVQEGLDAHRKAQAILRGMAPEKAFATSEKVGQFYRAGMGDLSSLVIDTWATRTATKGGMAQPGRARPGIESAFRKGAQAVGLQNAEFQAALWLLEKEESKLSPGQVGLGFQRGGKIRQSPGQTGMGFAPKFPRSRPFCTVCNTTMANEFDHRTTAKHKANLRGPSKGSGDWLGRDPSRFAYQRWDQQYDEEELEYEIRKLGLYPGGKWAPGMWHGGRARAYQMTLDQGGGTFDPQGNAPSRGYAVGTAEGTAHLVDDEDRLGFTRAFRSIAKSDTPYVGTWHHEGQIHVDPAIVARRKKDALAIARRQRQLAYYDLGHGEDIYTERRERDPVPGQLSLGMARGGRLKRNREVQAKLRGDAYGGSLHRGPYWGPERATFEDEKQAFLERYEEKATTYPGGLWRPGMAGGGRARPSRWGKVAPADPEWLSGLEGHVKDNRWVRTRKYNKPRWDEALDPEYLTRFRGDPHDRGPGSGHVYTEPMDPWMYHVTPSSNVDAIREQGVQPQRGGYNTYGSINAGKRRAYWSRYPDSQWGGRDPVALATKLSSISKPDLDEIGELSTTKGVDPSALFYLGANKRLNKLAGGGRARMRGAGFVPGLRSIAQGYNRMAGLPPMQEQMLHPLNADFSRRTAAAYEALPGGTDPLSRRAYGAFAEETEAQYKYLQQAGFQFEPDPGDPYTPKPGGKLTKMQLAARDVSRNKRLLAFSSALEHPLLTNEQNLMFRHVHDMMGHLTEGYSIGPRGEFNAAVKHSQMFSPLARRAMLAETHGQNSVVNFSPTVLPGYGGRSIAEVNKGAPGTIYADQKARGLPDDILEEFYRLTGIKRQRGGEVLKLSTVGKGGRWSDTARNTRGAANVRPADLKPYMLTDPFSYENPRYMSALMSSIRESGFFEPATVTIRGNGPGAYVTDGNHRVAIADLMGLESIPTRFRGPGGRFASPSALGIDKIKKAGGGPVGRRLGRMRDRLGMRWQFDARNRAMGYSLDDRRIQELINQPAERGPMSGRTYDAYMGGYSNVTAESKPGQVADPGEVHLTGQAMSKQELLENLRGSGVYSPLEPGRWSKNAAGGFIRSLFGRPGPSKDQLRAGYGSRFSGFSEKFGTATTPPAGPAMSALRMLGRTLSAEQREPNIDLEEALKHLPAVRREPGATGKFLRQQAQLAQLREAQKMRPLAGSQFEPGQQDLWAAPVKSGLDAKYIKVDPRWLQELGVDPTKISRNAAGGHVFRYADPNGLHLRPATALAKVGQMAELSGNPLKVTANGKAIGYPMTGSVLGWSMLGVRQGAKIKVEVGGTETQRVVSLLEKLFGFEGPEKTGLSYGQFHGSIGVASSAVTRADIADANRYRRASGGHGGKGRYIVNEIGREKFVPDRLAHLIPPDVMSELPKKKEGGIVEIPGHGARLWDAPEDGWIIPARLSHKVPFRHTGGPAEAGHAHPHRNRQGTGYQDQYGRPVPDSAIVGRQPVQDTFRGALLGAPMQGPPAPGSSWRGAMFGSGGSNALRDSFTTALESVFGRNSKNLTTPLENMAAPLEEMTTPQPTPRVGGQGYGSFAEAHVALRAQQVNQNVNPNDPDMLSAQRKKTFGIVQQAGATRRSFFESLPKGGGVDADEPGAPLGQNPLRILEQEARISAAAVRGLTPRSAAGGIGGAILGGGQARREAMVMGQGLTRAYERMLPEGFERGTDTLRAFGEQLHGLEEEGKTVTSRIKELGGTVESSGGKLTASFNKVDKSMVATDEEIGRLTDELDANQRAQGVARESIKTAGATRLEAERQFDKARGGAAANILSITAAGFAFSALSGAISTGLTLATKAAEPFVDEITGFQSTATRVTQGLAQQARQLGGNVPSAIAGAAGPAGVGGTGLDFLTRTLGPSVSAKAGAAAAQEASELFRAAAGAGRAPTGLFSGYGGVGGSQYLAEFLGGGKGFTETLAGDVGTLRGQQQGLEGINALRGPTNVGTGHDPIGDFVFGGGGTSRGFFSDLIFGKAPEADTGPQRIAAEVLDTELKDYNEAAKRGADALDQHTTGLHLATREQLKLTEATDDLQQNTMKLVGGLAGDESAGKLADQGVFLVDASNKIVANTEAGVAAYKKFFEQSAQGRATGDPTAFAAQQARGLQAQRQIGRIAAQRQIDVEIPGQFGMQLAANPFINAFAGIPGIEKASAGLVNNLEETNRLQKQVTKDAQAAVEMQAREVDIQSGTAQGRQFRSYMTDVTNIGKEIAGITEAISNRQAQVGFQAYSNNIRILNRSLSDARGLLSGRGGANNLGAIQRAQFDLSRQSQQLSMQSQRLQLQSNQLQLDMSQRQINFQRAIAGFQAPGITGQERAARMAEAELEASFAQKQLNIGVQQQGIGQKQLGITGEQFGLELQAFMESARRSVVDLEAQKAITVAQFQLEQEQIAAQKRIAVRTAAMGLAQAKAQALVNEAQGNFNSTLSSTAQYLAQFGGVAAAATAAIMKALRLAPGTSRGGSPGAYYPSNQTPHASGYNQYVNKPTSFVAGDAGGEQVLVIRNPTSGVMGAPGSWGGGSAGGSIQINISGNTFGGDLNPDDVARKLADEVERRFDTKARLMNVSA